MSQRCVGVPPILGKSMAEVVAFFLKALISINSGVPRGAEGTVRPGHEVSTGIKTRFYNQKKGKKTFFSLGSERAFLPGGEKTISHSKEGHQKIVPPRAAMSFGTPLSINSRICGISKIKIMTPLIDNDIFNFIENRTNSNEIVRFSLQTPPTGK